MNKALYGALVVLILVLAGFIGLFVQGPVQHEINMRRDPIYAEAYETLVPYGYPMDVAYGFVSDPDWDNVVTLVLEYGYTIEEAFYTLPFYRIAASLESQLEYVDVLHVVIELDANTGFPYLLVTLNINPILLPEIDGGQELIDATNLAFIQNLSNRFITKIYFILGFDTEAREHVTAVTECDVFDLDVNSCLGSPIEGDLYPEFMPWVGPTPLLDN